MHSKQFLVLGSQDFVLACQCSFLLEQTHTRGSLLLQTFLVLAQIRQQLLANSTQLCSRSLLHLAFVDGCNQLSPCFGSLVLQGGMRELQGVVRYLLIFQRGALTGMGLCQSLMSGIQLIALSLQLLTR